MPTKMETLLMYLKWYFQLCCNSFEVYEMTEPIYYKSLVFGDEFLAQGLHLKSHQRCSAGIRTWLSADQIYNMQIYLCSF